MSHDGYERLGSGLELHYCPLVCNTQGTNQSFFPFSGNALHAGRVSKLRTGYAVNLWRLVPRLADKIESSHVAWRLHRLNIQWVLVPVVLAVIIYHRSFNLDRIIFMKGFANLGIHRYQLCYNWIGWRGGDAVAVKIDHCTLKSRKDGHGNPGFTAPRHITSTLRPGL